LNFHDRVSKKTYSNIKFHENPSSGSPAVLCGQTDRHDEANSRIFAILRTRKKKFLKNQTLILQTDF